MVFALVVTAFVAFRWGSAQAPADSDAARPSPSASAGPLSVAEIYGKLEPSVVSIEAAGAGGTGVIVNAEGIILTALHVVEGAGTIEVTFADGTRSAASVVAADAANDIAALSASILPALVVPAVLGASARLIIGDTVVAIGNQLGLADTTTSGVVSGLERTADRKGGGGRLQGLIQFDAAVNPGSSGGPLLNTKGEVVGIVVALANPTDAGTFIGIGFAVPIGTAVTTGGSQQPQL